MSEKEKDPKVPQLADVLRVLDKFVGAHFPKAQYATLVVRLEDGIPSVTIPVVAA
jgi:hypothetical protein